MESIKNLLQNVAIIKKKYDDLAEYSGEHYNIFDILGLQTSELSHSAILTNLLDSKGKHGQNDVFLKLFLKQITDSIDNLECDYNNYLNSFDTVNAAANKEIYLGGVNFDKAEGGRVDIVITSANKNIIIENKINADDQEQQLLRYNNHYKNQPIIYLTLEGTEPSESSKGNLKLNKDFICCSYKYDITTWLEKCIKEMANKPIIRETLNQYLFLVKSLTNQSNNNKMSEEILKVMQQNICESFEIYRNFENLKITLFNNFINKVKNHLGNDFIVEKDGQIGNKDTAIIFKKNKWNQIVIELYFDGNNFSSTGIGIIENSINQDLKIKFLQNKIAFNNGKISEYPNWYIFYKNYSLFENSNSEEFWVNLNSDDFVNRFCDDLFLFSENIEKILENK